MRENKQAQHSTLLTFQTVQKKSLNNNLMNVLNAQRKVYIHGTMHDKYKKTNLQTTMYSNTMNYYNVYGDDMNL